MGAKTLWGVGHKENRFLTDFQRPGTTPNLGIEPQDGENQRAINLIDTQPPQNDMPKLWTHKY